MLLSKRGMDEILAELEPGQSGITAHHVRPSTPARYGAFPSDLNPKLAAALRKVGIERPYTHQAKAIRTVRAGRHLVLTTPTASGKTLCYNVPILERILEEPETRALYLFPTKALSQDQYSGLHRLIRALEVEIGTFTFDGDTRPDARRAVRDHGHVVITNPDMLHAGILPQHTRWAKLFENLRYLVIDETHTYRGIFGSHVANVLRRLRRVAKFHGSDPQIICCSATIANPVEHVRRLVGVDAELVNESGAPRGEHHLVCLNPPVVNEALQIRKGALRTAHGVAADLVKSKISTIVFAGSRLHVEVMLKYLRESMARARKKPSLIQGYRGGYLPNHRRRIEAGLRDSSIQGVVATNALELGIDIGSLDACVIVGYPGSIASLWQQSGRAGRRSGRSLTVFVARSSALDQYLVTHPEVLLGASPEHARIDPNNLFVLVDHVKCAAFEVPFEPQERFGDLSEEQTAEVLEYLASHGVLNESAGRFHWMERVYPANHVNLRGVHEENFVVIDLHTDRVLAEVDFRSAHTTLHEHAIYNLDSRQYQVERLDYDNHKAYVRRVEPDYYTTAMTYTRVGVLEEDDIRRHPRLSVTQGEVLVTRKVIGFKKLKFHTNENVGYGDITLPDQEMHTTACWFTLPDSMLAELGVDRATALDGLSGYAHALHVTATVKLMCAGRDLGRSVGDKSAQTSWRPGGGGAQAGSFEPTVFLYDDVPGGVGLAQEIHKRFEEIAREALALVAGCGCASSGCPSCMGSMPSYAEELRDVSLRIARMVLAEVSEPRPRSLAGSPASDSPRPSAGAGA